MHGDEGLSGRASSDVAGPAGSASGQRERRSSPGDRSPDLPNSRGCEHRGLEHSATSEQDGRLIAAALAAAIVETGAIIAAVRWSPSEPLKIWVGLTGLATAAGVLGVSVRQRRALLASLQEKAARLEVERDQEGRLGAAAERTRIAREMHDIVAHNLSVMIA